MMNISKVIGQKLEKFMTPIMTRTMKTQTTGNAITIAQLNKLSA